MKRENEKTDNDAEFLPKVLQKSTENRKNDYTLNDDQNVATSVNRFRVRAKPKVETEHLSKNTSDVVSNKNKSTKDGYKVSYINFLFKHTFVDITINRHVHKVVRLSDMISAHPVTS